MFHAGELGSYAQGQGSLAVFKVTARDQGHYKGHSGAFVTYGNITCLASLLMLSDTLRCTGTFQGKDPAMFTCASVRNGVHCERKELSPKGSFFLKEKNSFGRAISSRKAYMM